MTTKSCWTTNSHVLPSNLLKHLNQHRPGFGVKEQTMRLARSLGSISLATKRGLSLRAMWLLPSIAFVCLPGAVHGQTMKAPDISKTPTLYVVPYAHLDTQWRWEFPQTISEYLLKTMRVNFDTMDKYPHYVFNWTGANRYRLMKLILMLPKINSTSAPLSRSLNR